MNIRIILAEPKDSAAIAALVAALTQEICIVMNDHSQFNHNVTLIEQLCRSWIEEQVYTVLLAYTDGAEAPVGITTIAHTHALYAEGKIGVIQEFYVAPAYRNCAIGSALIDAAFSLQVQKSWACMELCTPPLPEFARSLKFYEKHGFRPVGGRKMRRKNPLNP